MMGGPAPGMPVRPSIHEHVESNNFPPSSPAAIRRSLLTSSSWPIVPALEVWQTAPIEEVF
jgi:hypothetical protein